YLGHPSQSEVRETRFVLDVATSNIRMVARKPELLKPIRLIWRSNPTLIHASPRHPIKICSVFVNCQRMPCPSNIWIKLLVIKFHSGCGDMQRLPPGIALKPKSDFQVGCQIGNDAAHS